jgi:hypothetical protein
VLVTFFGLQGVEAAGATKNLERALSFSLLELVAREGELVDKCVEVEAEEDAPPDARAEEDTPLDEAEELQELDKHPVTRNPRTLQVNAPLECKKIHAGEMSMGT